MRDRLIARWNDTQRYHTQKKPKRVYYFSLEFLQGRTLDNALLNLSVKDQYTESIKSLGFNMEDILDSERDAGLGNGGLGRLASCYLDSATTMVSCFCSHFTAPPAIRHSSSLYHSLISIDLFRISLAGDTALDTLLESLGNF